MNTIAEFIIYLGMTVGVFAFALVILAGAAAYVEHRRFESKCCWRIANWLDSL